MDDRVEQAMTWLAAGDVDRAEAAYRALPTEGAASASEVELGARIAVRRGDLAAAHALLASITSDDHGGRAYLHGQILFSMGRYDEAFERFSAADRAHPRSFDTVFALGNTRLAQSQFDEALPYLERAAALRPGVADPLTNLGTALGLLGDHAAARGAFHRAVLADPASLPAHDNLLRALSQTSTLVDAIGVYEDLLRARPASAEIAYRLGLLLGRAGQIEPAVARLEQAVVYAPDHGLARRSLAVLYLNQERCSDAMREARRAAELRPADAPSLYLLGYAMEQVHLDGTEAFRRAIVLEPTLIVAHVALAYNLLSSGDTDAALASLEAAREHAPEVPGIATAGARILEHRREHAASLALLEPLIQGGRRTPDVALAFGLLARDEPSRHRAVALIGEVLERNPARHVRRALLFQLGKLHDALQEYAPALRAFMEANALKSSNYSAAETERYFARLEAAFTRAHLERAPRSTVAGSERLVFVIGMPRSGTTLTESILGRHSDVHPAGELPDLANIVHQLAARTGLAGTWPEILPHLRQEHVDWVARTYHESVGRLAPAPMRIVDKMPHNFLHVGLIRLAFPDARVIHCTRDPANTIWSIFMQDFSGRHDYAYDLGTLRHYYPLYERLMAHWEAVAGPMHVVGYEDMVDDQERVTRELLAAVGLDFQPQCLSFHEAKRIVNTASFQQVTRPMYRDALDRWSNYAPLERQLVAGRSQE